MKQMESAGKITRSKGSSPKKISRGRSRKSETHTGSYAVCVNSGGYVDLEPLKVYKVRKDPEALKLDLMRIVDASGDDYLYPKSFFREITAPRTLFQIVARNAAKHSPD